MPVLGLRVASQRSQHAVRRVGRLRHGAEHLEREGLPSPVSGDEPVAHTQRAELPEALVPEPEVEHGRVLLLIAARAGRVLPVRLPGEERAKLLQASHEAREVGAPAALSRGAERARPVALHDAVVVQRLEPHERIEEDVAEAPVVILVGVRQDPRLEGPVPAKAPVPPAQEPVHVVELAGVYDQVPVVRGHHEAAVPLADVQKGDLQEPVRADLIRVHPPVLAPGADRDVAAGRLTGDTQPITPQEVLDRSLLSPRRIVHERRRVAREAGRAGRMSVGQRAPSVESFA